MGLEPGQCIVALDREYAPGRRARAADHEVALIPPVSGGAGRSARRVTGEPLDPAWSLAAVRDPRAGAVVCFEGVTRDVEALDYEAYAEMARDEDPGDQRRGGRAPRAVRGRLLHRIGRVPLSEPSVLVAARRAHRGEAFAGARALIDRVKAEAPIWKVELTARTGAGSRATARRMADLTLGEAAKALGVSTDTLRRWDRAGKLRTTRDARNRRLVPPEEVERLSDAAAAPHDRRTR